MMIRSRLILLLCCLLSLTLNAQKLSWDNTSFRFPVSTHQHNPLHSTFTFQNEGDTNVQIVNVVSGSDVLVENWSKGLIPPGGKGFLKATVTPSSISGPFTRTVTVITDEPGQKEYILTMEGEIRVTVDPFTEKYPLILGHLRYKSYYHLFYNLKHTETRTDTIFIYNTWDKEMKLGFDSLPNHLSIIPIPEKLKPKEEGILMVTYDATARNAFDMVFDKVMLKTNDALEPDKTLDIIAMIVDNFDGYAGDFSKAPVATFSSHDHDFGTVRSGTIVKYTLQITNTGVDTLMIRKVKTSCGCTVGTPDREALASAETATIRIAFNTFGRRGRQSQTVTILTNDPQKPTQLFTVQGNVK